MALDELGFLALVFVAATAAALGAARLLPDAAVRERLQRVARPTGASSAAHSGGWQQRLAQAVLPAGRLIIGDDAWENSTFRQRFVHAGFRGERAALVFFGAKAVLGAGLPTLLLLVAGVGRVELGLNAMLVAVAASAAVGYLAPNVFLVWRVEKRQETLLEHLPEAMDLLIIAMEAGLGLDAALARIAAEMKGRCPILEEELGLVMLELRAGAARAQALRNLAMRTGLEEIGLLTSTLVQADRFGTALGEALRQHAEALRTQRRLRAEEEAAKVALKILFPLILCIFPSIMIVLMGPAVIRIYRMFIPIAAG